MGLGPGRDAFHRVRFFSGEVRDAVERVPTGFRSRNGIIRRALRRNACVGFERAATIGLRRVAGELRLECLARRQVNDAQGALEEPGDVLHLLIGRTIDAGLRPARVGLGGQSFAVGDQQVLAVGRHAHRRGIPANWNEPQRTALARLLHVEDGHGVIIGVRDKQRLFVRRERQAVRRGPGRGFWIERRPNCLQGFAGVRVEHRHRVPTRIGHIEQLP